MGWPQFIIGWLLAVGLLVLGLGFGWRQIIALRQMPDLPDEERRRHRGQLLRRLAGSVLLLLLSLMMAGTHIWLEDYAQTLADLSDAARKWPEDYNSSEQFFIRFYAIYWIVFLLILLVLVFLAAYEIWTVRRQVLLEHRKLQADRKAMIARQAARMRRDRNGHE